MKRLFSGNEKHKTTKRRACKAPFPYFIIFPFFIILLIYYLAKEPQNNRSTTLECKKHKKIMYLADLCSAKDTVLTRFLRFPQLNPPRTKTPYTLRHYLQNILPINVYSRNLFFTISKLLHPDSSTEKLSTISVIVSELQYIFNFFFARVIAV